MIENAFLAFNTMWAASNIYNQAPMAASLLKKHSSKVSEKKKYCPDFTAEELPDFHMILAAYREENVLPYTIENLMKVPYKGQRKVWVTLETDDQKTQEVACDIMGNYNDMEVLIVDETEGMKGKPRALNYAFRHISREVKEKGKEENSIVGTLDAEDVVSSNLFDEVVKKIKVEGHDAVQGVLDMANDGDGWKNTMMRAEYGHHFRRRLPASAEWDLPLPFGGTTNFFKYRALERMCESNIADPWNRENVAEDFDIGIRMYMENLKSDVALGSVTKIEHPRILKTGTIDSVTYEESPTTWGGWLRQRTRWQKGKIQTLKEIRSMKAPLKKKAISVMECITPHMGPINLAGISLTAYGYLAGVDVSYLSPLFLYNMASIGAHSALNGIGYYEAAKNDKNKSNLELAGKAITAAATTPFYWGLQWVADMRALKQEYLDRRNFWEKTTHEGRHIDYIAKAPRSETVEGEIKRALVLSK